MAYISSITTPSGDNYEITPATLLLEDLGTSYENTDIVLTPEEDYQLTVGNQSYMFTIESDNTDTKVTSTVTTNSTMYLTGSTSSSTATGTLYKYADAYISGSAGTTSSVGTTRLTLGNSTASGTAANKQGYMRLYGSTAYYTDITNLAAYPTANRTIYLPRYAGTMYIPCTSTTSAVGGTAKPVYVTSAGLISACSSTIGGTAQPVYMSSGTITACSSTVGSSTTPVYMNAGTITACSINLSDEVSISSTEPTDSNVKIWIQTSS